MGLQAELVECCLGFLSELRSVGVRCDVLTVGGPLDFLRVKPKRMATGNVSRGTSSGIE